MEEQEQPNIVKESIKLLVRIYKKCVTFCKDQIQAQEKNLILKGERTLIRFLHVRKDASLVTGGIQGQTRPEKKLLSHRIIKQQTESSRIEIKSHIKAAQLIRRAEGQLNFKSQKACNGVFQVLKDNCQPRIQGYFTPNCDVLKYA